MSASAEPRPAPKSPPPRRIGRIVSISGARLVVLLDPDLDETISLQMGALVKIPSQQTLVFGLVEAMSIPMPRTDAGDAELRMLEISLMGEMPRGGPAAGRFQRGVTRQPALNDTVWPTDQNDAGLVYAMNDREAVTVGTVHGAPNVPAKLSVNDLLGKHFAMLGTTGTGKSCGVTVILKSILHRNPNAHVLLLDPHGEYGHAFQGMAEHFTGDTLRLPYWIFNFEELVEVIFGQEKESSAMEIMHLRELIVAAKVSFAKEQRSSTMITADTPIPYAIGEVNRLLEEAMGRLDNRALLGPYLNLKTRLHALQADRQYTFMFSTGLALKDNLAQLIGRLFRIPADGKPLSIVDLTGIPSEVLNVVVAVICRMAFDFALWGGQKAPLLLVCEEAHRYAPQDAAAGFEPAKRGLARIAKEGRKYGISLGVISQRPSDLASSILSQCSTILAFRMTNEKDQEIIQASLSEAAAPLVTSLPLLGNGEVLAIGEGTSVPMRMKLASLPPNERPRSGSAVFSDRWQDQSLPTSLLDDIVEAWRGHKTDI